MPIRSPYHYINQTYRFVTQAPVVRQSGITMIGTGFTGVIMAVAMIIASRGLGPELFGVFSVAISVMLLFSKGTDLGLNQLFPRLLNNWNQKPELQENFLAQMVQWRVRLSLVTVILGIVSVLILQSVLQYPFPVLLILAVVGAVALGWYEHTYLLLSASHTFAQLAVMSVLQAVLKLVGFSIALLLVPSSVVFIALVYFFSPVMSMVVIASMTRLRWWRKAERAKKQVQQAIWRFWPHAAVGSLAITLINNVDVLFVQASLETFETGIYAGATRLASFIVLITYALSAVLNNRVSRYKESAQLQQYLTKSLILVAAAIGGFIVFLPLAQSILTWTIGPEYISGLLPFIILVANALLGLAIVPYTSYFFAVDVPWYHSVGGVLQVAIILGGNFLFLGTYGLVAAALVRLVATAVFSVFTIAVIGQMLFRSK